MRTGGVDGRRRDTVFVREGIFEARRARALAVFRLADRRPRALRELTLATVDAGGVVEFDCD